MQDTDIKEAGEEMEKFAASSAGILCWSTRASDHSKSYSFVQKADGCVIRIPGPQVMKAVFDFVSTIKLNIFSFLSIRSSVTCSNLRKMTKQQKGKLPDGFLLSDAEYNSALADKPASRTADPTNPFVGVGVS